MSRVFFGVEKGFEIYQENGASLVRILSGTAAPTGTGDQASAAIGSIYLRSGTGEMYQKKTNLGAAGDWELNGSSSAVIGKWRNEKVVAVTAGTLAAGSIDLSASPLAGDESPLLTAADFTTGQYIIGGSASTPVLYQVTGVSSPSITIAVASPALVADDTFIVDNYLPDSPGAQEGAAIVNFNGSVIVKLADIDWNVADGIGLAAGYAPVNGSITNADTVNSAIEKLDGNQIDLIALSGVAQGATSLGTFTGSTIPDSSTNKSALQSLETAHEEVDANVNDLISLSGVAENSTTLGSFTGTTIPDSSSVKAALQSVETAYEETDVNVNDLISLSGVAENSSNLGTFTGDIIADSSTVKSALQDLETELVDTRQNADDLIALSGVAENATTFGTFTGVSLADSQSAKQLFQRIEVLLEQMRGVQVAAITTLATVDEVPVATVKACKWLVDVQEDATPANRKAFEVYALNNGTLVDDTQYAKLNLGSNFNLVLSVDISGGNMRLRASSSSAGVTVTARRIEVVKSIL